MLYSYNHDFLDDSYSHLKRCFPREQIERAGSYSFKYFIPKWVKPMKNSDREKDNKLSFTKKKKLELSTGCNNSKLKISQQSVPLENKMKAL